MVGRKNFKVINIHSVLSCQAHFNIILFNLTKSLGDSLNLCPIIQIKTKTERKKYFLEIIRWNVIAEIQGCLSMFYFTAAKT